MDESVKNWDFCLACGENHGGWPEGECTSCGALLEALEIFISESPASRKGGDE